MTDLVHHDHSCHQNASYYSVMPLDNLSYPLRAFLILPDLKHVIYSQILWKRLKKYSSVSTFGEYLICQYHRNSIFFSFHFLFVNP